MGLKKLELVVQPELEKTKEKTDKWASLRYPNPFPSVKSGSVYNTSKTTERKKGENSKNNKKLYNLYLVVCIFHSSSFFFPFTIPSSQLTDLSVGDITIGERMCQWPANETNLYAGAIFGCCCFVFVEIAEREPSG